MSDEKQYLEVIQKLISGTYRFSTGSPDSKDIEETTLAEIRERLPELRHMDDEELSQLVADAINYAMEKLCTVAEYSTRWGTRKASVSIQRPGYSREFGWMKCYHPEIGEFHIVFDEDSNYDAGVFYHSYSLTKNPIEAKSDFFDIKREVKEIVV